MKITFLGAARNVTGSRFLVEAGKCRILVDCGLHQEWGLRKRDWEPFPVDPQSIAAVLLTHAHVDHCGYLPRLVRGGFRGRIFCTPATAGIARIALLDSAHLQESDAEYKRRRHAREKRRGPRPEEPLYTVADAHRTFPMFRRVNIGRAFRIGTGLKAVFHEAGHILGSVIVELIEQRSRRSHRIVFSGDLGRGNRPLLRDPALLEEADAVVMESTYGDEDHPSDEEAVETMARVIRETSDAGGNIVIPAFAIGRTQEILYHLKRLTEAQRIPRLMTFLDSPMAIEVTGVFVENAGALDRATRAMFRAGESPFTLPMLTPTPGTDASKSINRIRGSAIILAGSGMCTGGRIKHHLANNIGRPESTILFVGYQAQGTLGHEIVGRPSSVRILGQIHPVRARIVQVEGFSAHAGRRELIRWIGNFRRGPAKLFLVHGEAAAIESLATTLREKLPGEVVVPEYGASYNL
ncbi:MAG: MBL fold hydrolase [Candidatus Omnitrophica bacterium CG11_big_fil_rev_8_21_14_0_20_64_10]|nr:MAG: MBL fold hydrolase [Candidatus Omnitrophica bacterium CG11_big_fil_rev_8_21_14_0_20_64_10]